MSKVEKALEEHGKMKAHYYNRVNELLKSARDDIASNPEELLNIIRKEGGDNWVYKYWDNMSLEDRTAIEFNKRVKIPLDIEGFEGCFVCLSCSFMKVYLHVNYTPS